MQGTFPAVAAAIETVMPVTELAYIGYAHCEGDECGAMNLFLEAVGLMAQMASLLPQGLAGLAPLKNR